MRRLVLRLQRKDASIDAHSPFADIKYAINRSPADLIAKPDVLLRMLEAERLGLVVIKVETKDFATGLTVCLTV